MALERPALRWSGAAYFDANAGSEPLEAGFRSWDWSRAGLRRGTAVLYDAVRRDGSTRLLALRFDPDGRVETFEPPPPVRLPATGWRVARGTRADAGHGAAVVETLEDTPFYARSLLRTHLLGERATAVHESLSLDRFRTPLGAGAAAVPDAAGVGGVKEGQGSALDPHVSSVCEGVRRGHEPS